jgi:hypothetical protein
MTSRNDGMNQETAAAKAGFSVRSGRRVERGERQAVAEPRSWRTRADPLTDVWESELVALLETAPDLTGLSLLEYLDDRYPGRYPESLLRTLQRRVKEWRALHGPEKAVIFRQALPPGQMGLSDFTHPASTVTINGVPFVHLLYQYRLAYSGWRYVQVVLGGESYPALAEGLQNALNHCGGSPREHRTDSLSAAYVNQSEKRELTVSYEALCAHYAMRPTRNNPGVSHENGAIECAHGSFKRRLDQALKCRGSAEFDSRSSYQAFIEQVVLRLNRRIMARYLEERGALGALPERRYADFTSLAVCVSRSSTIEVKRVTYSVPSRLIGERLRIHVHYDQLEVYLGVRSILSLPRVYPRAKGRARCIDYRHLIHGLAAKPQAFRYSQLRDDLLPSEAYRRLWHYVDTHWPREEACKWIVTVLRLAADHDCEARLAEQLLQEMAQGRLSSRNALLEQFLPLESTPAVHSEQHPLLDYDALLETLRCETSIPAQEEALDE